MSDEKNINNREFLEIIPPEFVSQPGINDLKIEPNIEIRQRETEFSGSFDTSDSTIEKVDYLFNLNVPDPDGKIFSLGVDGNIFSFKCGFFNNTYLAYLQFASSLQVKLGSNYVVSYISGTTVRISKLDGTSLSISNPGRTKQFILSSFDSDSIIKITIDGTDYTIDGATFSGNPNSALLWIQGQLPSGVYYSNVSGNTFIILRQDGGIVNISKTQYDRYTYLVSGYSSALNLTSTNVGGISGIDEIKEYKINVGIDGNNTSYTLSSGLTFSDVSNSFPFSNCPGITPSQSDVNSNTHGTKAIDMLYGIIPGAGYIKGAMQSYATYGTDFWGYQFTLRKTDYSQITISQNTDFVKDTTLALYNGVNQRFGAISTNHKADITISNYTEISITLSVFSYNLYIPVSFAFKTIIMTAVSSVGSSDNGLYDSSTGEQSCTSKYSSTTTFVDGYVFKTGESNYGNIVRIEKFGNKRGFVIHCLTTVSNKLDYICKA